MLEKIINLNGVDYLVRTDGKIFSTKKFNKDGSPIEIKQRLDHDGYYVITCGSDKQRSVKRVHRLLAEMFIPNDDKSLEVDHKDNNRLNNDISNLQWITHADNVSKIPFEIKSKCRKGERNGRAILNEEDIIVIRRMYKDGMSVMEIAREFGRGWTTINHVIKGETWKN